MTDPAQTQAADPGYTQESGNEEVWATIFGPGGHPDLVKQHRVHRYMPSDPRCRLCLVPFGGLGGFVMSRRGKAPSSRNKHYCAACDGFLEAFPGGAEVEMSILYVDIRNSVSAAEGARPADVSARVNRFLSEATEIITDNDGFIMAFYGDCVVAVWPPGFAGPDHAAKALAAARALARAFPGDSGIPAGTGVHTGMVYIGTVAAAQGTFRDVSIFGTSVNITARLASAAKAGEALASEATAQAAGLAKPAHSLEVKGLSAPIAAISVA